VSSYHSGFKYLNQDSKDKGWIIASFDPDSGEMDSYLSQEQIYTDSYKGTKRLLYGTKYDAVATVKITVVKCNGSDFSVQECRDAYKWLTGNPVANWLQLYVGDTVQYEFIGTVQNVAPYKLDARTVGLIIYFESISPWAYSPVQTFNCSFDQSLAVNSNGVLQPSDNSITFNVDSNGIVYQTSGVLDVFDNGTIGIDNSVMLQIDNQTDDLYTYIYMDTVFDNHNSDYLSIKNATLNEETILYDMGVNEKITLSSMQFITSSIANKIFGNNFNFVWPRLKPGINTFVISGSGSGYLQFSYRYPIKIGDCAMDVNEAIENGDCGCSGGNNGDNGGTGEGGNTVNSCYVNEAELYAMLNRVLS
jgi:hypothetical protein